MSLIEVWDDLSLWKLRCARKRRVFFKVEMEWIGASWLQFIHSLALGLRQKFDALCCTSQTHILNPEWEELSLWDFRCATKNCSRDFTLQLKEVLIWDSISIRSFLNYVTFLAFPNLIYMSWELLDELPNKSHRTCLQGIKDFAFSSSLMFELIPKPLLLLSPTLSRFRTIMRKVLNFLQTVS